MAAYLSGTTARDIASSVTTAVRDGRLAPGTRLPTIRAAATQLSVAPATVSAAWGLLSRSGVIETDGRRGTRVRAAATDPGRYRRAVDRGTAFALDLSTGVPDPGLLPDLAAALRRVHKGVSVGSYLDEPVLPELVEVLRADWPYAPEAFTILDGAMDALDQIASVHLRPGDVVAVEQPGFPPLLDLLDALGTRQVGVPCDGAGPTPDGLSDAIDAGARAVFLQPRAQNPTGLSVTPARARALVAVLRRHPEVIVIEDDSSGPIATAQPTSLGQWLPARTLHIRSFSKSHGPDLRLAAVSGPHTLLDPVIDRRFLGQGWSSRLLQAVLVDLLTHDEPLRQVERARTQYAHRREHTVEALRRHGLALPPGDGFNVWIPVVDETSALLQLASHGIGAAAGSSFWIDAAPAPHIRVTTGLIRDEFDEVAATIARAAESRSWAGPR